MNILLQFVFGFYNFGERYVTNRGWHVLYVFLRWSTVSSGGVGVQQGVVHTSAMCPCRRCVRSGEVGHFPVSELH